MSATANKKVVSSDDFNSYNIKNNWLPFFSNNRLMSKKEKLKLVCQKVFEQHCSLVF